MLQHEIAQREKICNIFLVCFPSLRSFLTHLSAAGFCFLEDHLNFRRSSNLGHTPAGRPEILFDIGIAL